MISSIYAAIYEPMIASQQIWHHVPFITLWVIYPNFANVLVRDRIPGSTWSCLPPRAAGYAPLEPRAAFDGLNALLFATEVGIGLGLLHSTMLRPAPLPSLPTDTAGVVPSIVGTIPISTISN